MGPGPGEFLSALINYAKLTYLNRDSIAVYMLCHEEYSCQCHLLASLPVNFSSTGPMEERDCIEPSIQSQQ